jgi:ABC-type microcin C transport system permease subunit YejE
MKSLWMVLVILVVFSLVGMGCESKSHSLYRQQNLREVSAADEIGVADDVEAAVLLSEHPAHLTQWYPR